MSTPKTPLKILLEMRPALQGHAGVPQETRLLFRGLSMLENVCVEGLLQSGDQLLARGLPPNGKRWLGPLSTDRQLNRLGRVVIALEEPTRVRKGSGPKQRRRFLFLKTAVYTVAMACWHAIGGRQELSRFDANNFRDYIWRRFFARTLPSADFDLVTRAGFRIARVPWAAMHICGLFTRHFGPPIYLRLDTADFDLMIAETPYPGTVSGGTRLIVRYHDAIPVLMPHTISDRKQHQAQHYRAVRNNVNSGAWFVCVSDATRNDLLSIFPQAEPRALTIHNMVSHDYFDEDSSADRVPEIIKTRLNTKIKPPLDASFRRTLFEEGSGTEPLQYLLVVSTIEPRKNHLTLLAAWEQLRRVGAFPTLKLLVVGETGWRQKAIVGKFRPWMERGDAFLVENVPSADLRLLYKHARATICPSFGEGFDFSGVEAMKSGGAVVASDIAVHREIYADAAEYFNPYSVGDAARAIQNVIHPTCGERRDELIANGAIVSRRYDYEVILPQWESFLKSVSQSAGNTSALKPP
jgi:glycosyltransferase involved in cell wall biosynthesis